ncbi:MAG: saccharopine dehydrogenase C-terminal domain-containing protein [Cyclobacteriaceae bacterium]
MKKVLVLGAGRSSSALIDYLLDHAENENWQVVVGDMSLEAASKKVSSHPRGTAIQFNLADTSGVVNHISSADAVISLIPPHLHAAVAAHCVELGKHLLTASYVTKEMQALNDDAARRGVLLLNECGLDPGIDHMSAMQLIDRIKAEGGQLTSFESFTGGLIAPTTDPENPWRYKFTWNPRNVVMAGQGTARFLDESKMKYISYQQLFKRITTVHIPTLGDFEGYANRDSLKYIDAYGLNHVDTMVRGTLRNAGFCGAWNILVQLGCTEDGYAMDGVEHLTHRDFINSFLPVRATESVEEKVTELFDLKPDGHEMKCLRWSGFFDREPVGLSQGTPAQILEYILNKKWRLQANDHDMIVMWHRFKYKLDQRTKEVQASLHCIGQDGVHTAMAKTVGLPLAIAAKLLLQGKIKSRGVCIPTVREIYGPVLEELGHLGIKLAEWELS